MTYPKETKKARLYYLYGKRYSLAARLEADPKNLFLQIDLDNINAEIGRLKYQTNEAENREYNQLNNDDELEL